VTGTASTRWSRLFALDDTEEATALMPHGEGLTVLGANGTLWLASLDGLGLPTSQTTADAWSPVAIAETTNGETLVAGTKTNSMRIIRFDDSLSTPIWARTWGVVDAESVTCVAMVPTATGGAILAGRVNRSSVLTPILTAVSGDGEVRWSIEIDMGFGSSRPVILALAEDNAGGFIAVGSVEYSDPADPSISRKNALILRFTDEGELGHGYALGGDLAESARQIVVHPDGSYTIGGHFDGAPNIWLASVDVHDALVWSASYRIRPDTDFSLDLTNLRGLAPTAANGVVLCGEVSLPDIDAWMLHANAVGMPLWGKCYSSAGIDDVLTGVVTLENGFAAFGRIQVVPNIDSDPWILCTSVDGMASFTEASGLVTDNTQVEWQRVRDHAIHALQPVPTPATLEVESDELPPSVPATGFGQLITE
jgi:hypothetical protein